MRLHQRSSVPGSEVAPPHVRDPVGIRVLESRLVSRSLRKSLEQRAETLGDPPQNRVRERNRPLRSRGAHELHRLVHGGVTRDAVHVAELVCAEAERRPHRSVELLDTAASERADRVVERPHALNGAERESQRERRIWVNLVAVHRELRLRQRRVRLTFRLIDLVLEPGADWDGVRFDQLLQLRGDLEVDRNRTRAIDDDAPPGAEFCLPTHIAFPYFVMTKY